MNKQSSITHILNTVTVACIRWCTPSIQNNLEKVKNYYASDMSVSYEELGFPSEPSGMFLEAYKRAAKAYGSDKTLFSVNGCTGSNFIVLRTLARQIPNVRILALRNIHKSVLHACEDYGINLHFTNTYIDPHLHMYLPPPLQEIVRAIKTTKPHVLLITNPTYEGFTLDLQTLIRSARKINPELIVFVDEAWGARLAFSNRLPPSAMQCGADICTQSAHKQGGALQQTSMIHWKEKRINTGLLLDSYRNLSTTSPSYILLASIDAARKHLEKHGRKSIHRSLKIAKSLAKELDAIPGFRTVKLSDVQKNSPAVFDADGTKVILDVTKSGYTGFTLAKLLEKEYNIIVEKYNAPTILFLVPFQTTERHIKHTVEALKKIIITHGNKRNGSFVPSLEIPKNTPKNLELRKVTRLPQSQIEKIPLKHALGRISAENITPYPPGIPTTIQGEQFTLETIRFYESLRHYPNSHVLAHDIALKTVLVVK